MLNRTVTALTVESISLNSNRAFSGKAQYWCTHGHKPVLFYSGGCSIYSLQTWLKPRIKSLELRLSSFSRRKLCFCKEAADSVLSVLLSFNGLNKGFKVLTFSCFYDSRRNSFASLSQNGLSHSLGLALILLAL